MRFKIFAATLILLNNAAFADLLPEDSPERAQLIAMGYSLKDYQTLTIATLGDTAIGFEKNSVLDSLPKLVFLHAQPLRI